MEHFFMINGKMVQLTKEQADKLEKTGTYVHEVNTNMTKEELNQSDNKIPFPVKPIESIKAGQKKNYIFFARKNGM